MRSGRDRRGRGRVWYDFDEIEQLAASSLRAAGLWPEPELRAVDIERLIEVHLGASVDYAADLPPNVLGKTEFRTPPHVEISRALTVLAAGEDAPLGLRGRWRATVAHEAAHILLHAPLLRGASPIRDLVGCYGQTIEDPSDRYGWIEVQANMGMVALLMPREPFVKETRRLLGSAAPVFPPLDAESRIGKDLVERLARRFEASHQATRLRLVTFGFVRE